jgi:hypothetical protein
MGGARMSPREQVALAERYLVGLYGRKHAHREHMAL